TISSDEPAYFALTLQPVAFVNGFTHCGCVYPSHPTRLSWPSPLPIVVGSPLPALTPAAATHNAAAKTARSTCALLIRITSLFPPWVSRMCVRAATRGGRG